VERRNSQKIRKKSLGRLQKHQVLTRNPNSLIRKNRKARKEKTNQNN
jgi:hypothetical protein